MRQFRLLMAGVLAFVFCYSGRFVEIKPCPYQGEVERRYYYQAARWEALTGIDHRILLAHIKVETDEGRHHISVIRGGRWTNSGNLFAIKAGGSWTGLIGRNWTREYIRGEWVIRKQYWRVYPTVEAAFRDYIMICSNPSNRWAEAWKHRRDPERYFQELVRRGWATDPRFAEICAKRARTLR